VADCRRLRGLPAAAGDKAGWRGAPYFERSQSNGPSAALSLGGGSKVQRTGSRRFHETNKENTMEIDNPFDRKLETWGDQIPSDVREAALFVTDTLELCWTSAQAVFEDKATPAIALEIYDRVLERMALNEANPKPKRKYRPSHKSENDSAG
jgi:hypothetical protein